MAPYIIIFRFIILSKQSQIPFPVYSTMKTELSNQGKEYGKEMDRYNKMARDMIFKGKLPHFFYFIFWFSLTCKYDSSKGT